jgi:hypothetical protein
MHPSRQRQLALGDIAECFGGCDVENLGLELAPNSVRRPRGCPTALTAVRRHLFVITRILRYTLYHSLTIQVSRS